MNENNYHESVMVRETVEALHIENQASYIDATVGTGGHALEILKKGGRVLGIETDPEILEIARERLKKFKGSCQLALGNFNQIDIIAKEYEFRDVSGIIFDLGVNNLHLESQTRGFSFSSPEAPLDMRLNAETQGVKASDLLNVLRKDQLAELFSATMDGGSARWLANKIVLARGINTFITVNDFLRVCTGLRGKPGINAATLPFLAVRIAVNSELENLREALPKAYGLLKNGGRLVVLSFHSGEDRIVKEFAKSKPIVPSEEEIIKNPRARSAKMRAIIKT